MGRARPFQVRGPGEDPMQMPVAQVTEPGEQVVSIIFTPANVAEQVNGCMNSLLAQSFKKFGVIAVVRGSRDGTDARLRDFLVPFPGMKLAEIEGISIGDARNRAMKIAPAPLVLFVDMACRFPKEWIGQSIAALGQSQNASGIGSPNSVPDDESAGGRVASNLFSFFHRMIFRPPRTSSGYPSVLHPDGGAVLYRKQEVLDAGGFNAAMSACEDVDLHLRLRQKGKGLAYAPSLALPRYRPGGFREFIRKAGGLAFSWGQLIQRYSLLRRGYTLFPSVIVGLFLVSLFIFAGTKDFIFPLAPVCLALLAGLVLGLKSAKGRPVEGLLAALVVAIVLPIWGVNYFFGRLAAKKKQKPSA